MKTEQSISPRQKMVMSQYQKQALAVLSSDADALAELISREEESNPFMEVRWPHAGLDRDVNERPDMERYIGQEADVMEDLRTQFHLAAPKELYPVGEYLIDSLSEQGYLNCTAEEAARWAHLPAEKGEKALRVLQSLNPAGIGARSLRENLLLQLRRREDRDLLAESIVQKELSLLAGRKWKQIALDLGAEEEDVRNAAEAIRSLNPYPLYGLSLHQAKERYVRPDLLFSKAVDHVEVSLAGNLPEIRINAMDLGEDREAKRWAGEYIRSAKNLMNAIERRSRTLLGIGALIARVQAGYFLQEEPLKPFTRKEAAEMLNVHPSTVSRAIEGKYLEFEGGVIPLEKMFQPRISSGASREEVKAVIRRIVENENPAYPVTDGQISRYLNSSGVSVSKRTITKYRTQMSIPAASLRKH